LLLLRPWFGMAFIMIQIMKRGSALRAFLKSEAIGGIILMASAAIALIIANSAFAHIYFAFIHADIGPVITPTLGRMTAELWINDGLMALFFLLVGLEIKREFADGELSTWPARRLPMIAALAGMAVPAIIYVIVIGSNPTYLHGWAIPAATDIAFAIGVLTLLGSRVPASLKLLLTTVAIVDDIGAVAIIALFYTSTLNMTALAAAALIWGIMMILCRMKIMALWPYLLLSGLLWYATLLSGVHATIAGVLAAFAIPFERTIASPDAQESTLHRLEHMLAGPVAYFIIPLFGFANAGVALGSGDGVFAALPMAIALGLFAGKQIGIFTSIWCAVKFSIAAKPADASWPQIYGLSVICGIGFTMSLFIGGLAFNSAGQIAAMKIGVLMGSLASAILGSIIFLYAAPKKSDAAKKVTEL
jgi:Na+:H+ antiporter, NhaA family